MQTKLDFFFQMLPNTTLALKGDWCHGGKQSKLRITALLCVNKDASDKRVPLVIGKSKKPQCFKNARKLEVQYTPNKKAWISRDIFPDWPREFDKEMKSDGRSVCLLVDNCSAHHVDDVELTNVELQFFPPNCTSLVQPLDQGIISSVKCVHRRRLIDKLLLDLRLKRPTKVDIFQALEMFSASWKATSKEVIRNCFRKAGFEHGLARTASTPEECDSAEDREEAMITAHALSEEND